jgi:hypothetical protein
MLVNNQGSGALNDLKVLFQPILFIYVSARVCKDRKGQMENFGVSPSFIKCASQNQEDLTIFGLEIFIKPAQLAGMTAALNSVKFPYKEYYNVVPGANSSQLCLCPITSGQGKVRGRRADD